MTPEQQEQIDDIVRNVGPDVAGKWLCDNCTLYTVQMMGRLEAMKILYKMLPTIIKIDSL